LALRLGKVNSSGYDYIGGYLKEGRMDNIQKLSVVIEHWIEHNEAHTGEYQKWAKTAGEMGLKLVKEEIEEAIGKLLQSNGHLEKAIMALKSPL
jgi:hypothetical protein